MKNTGRAGETEEARALLCSYYGGVTRGGNRDYHNHNTHTHTHKTKLKKLERGRTTYTTRVLAVKRAEDATRVWPVDWLVKFIRASWRE